MSVIELRDRDVAQLFLCQGLWLQRVAPATANTVRPALEWALEIASAGHALPPIGFVADLGSIIFDPGHETRAGRDLSGVAALPPGLIRRYEDLVLGKVFADWTVDRAREVLRHLQGRNRNRGLGFVVSQFLERGRADGVVLSPAVIKAMLESPPDEILVRGWDQLGRQGLMPLLPQLYDSLIAASGRVAEVLAPEDVFELEHGTALAELGQRVAIRQVLQIARRFEDAQPARRMRREVGRREIPTRVLDEDTYPVGGFASLSNRGSLESLLHSQLAFMEPAMSNGRPDLFDVKYLRDELLYYSRDENQFLRRRRTFIVVLAPDLVHARFKDVDLPAQRIVMVLGMLVAAVRRLTAWLSEDALQFVFLFPADSGAQPLTLERQLLDLVFREAVANGTVRLEEVADMAAAAKLCRERARRSLCHALIVGIAPPAIEATDIAVAQLALASPEPQFTTDATEVGSTADEPIAAWDTAFVQMLQFCE